MSVTAFTIMLILILVAQTSAEIYEGRATFFLNTPATLAREYDVICGKTLKNIHIKGQVYTPDNALIRFRMFVFTNNEIGFDPEIEIQSEIAYPFVASQVTTLGDYYVVFQRTSVQTHWVDVIQIDKTNLNLYTPCIGVHHGLTFVFRGYGMPNSIQGEMAFTLEYE